MAISPHPSAKSPEEIVRDFLRKSPRRPLIVIIGSTASGKTTLSIRLARSLETAAAFHSAAHAEIINADSRQFYHSLDIGTAKIRPEEMKGISHHLLSVLDPKEPCSIAWFKREATTIIDAVHACRNTPILVGGSMLYVSAIVDGLQPLPSSDRTLRTNIEAEYDADRGTSLMEELRAQDPLSAASIDRRNKVYLVRAVEILRLTGTPKSKQLTCTGCPYDLLMLGVLPPSDLRERIECRIQAMFEEGWMEEVESLLERGYTEEDPGMGSIGYKEIAGFLRRSRGQGDRGNQGNQGEESVGLMALIVKKTRAYAKRQMTWWKRDQRIRWIRL